MNYFYSNNFQVTEKGYVSKQGKKTTIPPERITGKIDKEVVGSPNYIRAFFLFVLGCFVISEATVSGSYFAPIVAYIVGTILIVGSFYSLTYRLIQVRFWLTNGNHGEVSFGKNKPADEFIEAMERMLADHKASQKVETGQ